MKPNTPILGGGTDSLAPRAFGPCLLAGLIHFASCLQAALPTPLLDLPFAETTGETTANVGSLGGVAQLVVADGFPTFTNNVPKGPLAPANNTASLNMGAIAAGQGNRAVDLLTAVGLAGSLGALPEFTICGWLNPRDLTIGSGGNRIVFALESPNGNGIDLVQLANGSLRIGINQWPDGANGGGPSSSSGKLKADPQLGANNWVFFAVTYDPTLASGNVKYYFGNPNALATLDVARNYKGGIQNGGTVDFTGPPTLGNFGAVVSARTALGPTSSRVFRGLMDELKIYDRALGLAEIQQAQMNGVVPQLPVSLTQQPASQTVFAGQIVTFNVGVNGTAPIAFQWQTNGVDVAGATESTFTLTKAALTDHGLAVRVRVSNPVTSSLWSEVATLSVLPETGQKISLSFSEGTGTTTANQGNLSGQGKFAQASDFPAFSTNVPSGPFAPANNRFSLNMGLIAEGQGSRAVDFANPLGNTLGSLTAFTICGWVNVADLRVGSGGNRIVFALASPAGPGFDLVQLSDGSIQIGVNQWPDGSPARSSAVLTEDPDLGSQNWVFFAVTYDGTQSSGNASFHFGSGQREAQADVTTDYNRGPILTSGSLTVGNFGAVEGARTATGPTGSRCFRGLIDEIKVFNKVLSVAEIRQVQMAPVELPLTPPTLHVQRAANSTVELWWESTGLFQLQSRAAMQAGGWTDVSTPSTAQGGRSTVTVPVDAASQFFRLRSK